MYKSPALNLVKAAQLGDIHARDQVLIASKEFISYIARDLSKRYQSLEFDDCVQSGYFGVIDAIDTFDLSKGTQFFTHAKHRIHNSILKLIRSEDSQSRISVKAAQRYESSSSEPFSHLVQVQTNRQLRRRIYSILKPFPKLIRKWVVLKLLGNSYVKIAQRFNTSRHLVSAEVRRVLKILRRQLSLRIKPLSIKRLPSVKIKPGNVTRPRPIPLAAVFSRLRALCSNLVRSSQPVVQQLLPFPVVKLQLPSLPSNKPTVYFHLFAGQGLGIPPPPPE